MSTGGRLRASVRYVDPGRGGTAGGQETTTPINTLTNTAGPKIKVGRSPTAIAITPDGKTAYVVNYRSDSVTPIRIATNTALAPIPVGRHPVLLIASHDGTTVYVENGTWDQAIKVPGTGAQNTGVNSNIIAITCARPGLWCTAAGYLLNNKTGYHPFVVSTRQRSAGQLAVRRPGPVADRGLRPDLAGVADSSGQRAHLHR
jgi:YVTN family beta-propeller protein